MTKLWPVIAIFCLGCAGQEWHEESCADSVVKYRFVGTSASADARFKRDFCLGLLRVRHWWGRSIPGPFTVDVDESTGPSMALVPSWRGQPGTMLFRSHAVERGMAAIVHELTHVFAPNANRLLAEGLAVHSQMALGGNKAYPNFGQDLHRLARPLAARAKLADFDRVATPARLEFPGVLGGQDSYVVAGSFVRFLIETHGMGRFRRLYAMTPLVPGERDAGAPERWVAVYGKPLDALSGEWRAALR